MYLDETDICALLSEALTADVEAVLSDETGWVSADTAVVYMSVNGHTQHIRLYPCIRGFDILRHLDVHVTLSLLSLTSRIHME